MIKINRKYIFLLIISFIFAFLSGGNLPYSIFYVLILVMVFELMYFIKVRNNVFITLNTDKKEYYTGECGKVEILVRGIGTPYIYVFNENIKKLNNEYNGNTVSVNSFNSKLIKVNIKFKYRGIYDLGFFKIKIKDLFGIISITKDIHLLNKEIKVYPKIHNLCEINVYGGNSKQNIINSNLFMNGMTSTKNIRKYNLGDSMRKIHWKVSAKHSELYVKEFESVLGSQCNIFLNMNKESFFIENKDYVEEKLIEYCVSLCKHMQNKGISSSIFINDKHHQILEVYDNNTFFKLMDTVINVKSNGDMYFEKYINSNIHNISNRGLLLIITVDITEELTNTLIKIVQKGFQVEVFYYMRYSVQSKLIDSMNKFKIRTQNLSKVISL